MFRGITTQTDVIKQGAGRGSVACPPRKEKKMAGLGFSEGKDYREPTTAEDISLVRKIDNNMKNLIQSLNSIESLTGGLNKNLLPQLPKAESNAKVEAGQPQGWLERHLADIEIALWRSGQIYDEVHRLTQETKTDKVGQ